MSTLRYLSLFSGMEAAHLACSPLGWECAAVAEIEPAACQLLAHRLPRVPNLGSVTDVTDEQIAALGPMDVVIGGSPCQDLSVAGKRAGLAGARSSLFHEQLRIFNAARHFCGARWLVWENVPGAFSSNAGRDFAAVVGAMAGADLVAPAGGWGSEGVAVGANGLVEWCVLDAQWFGVAQRRRRVFAVLDTGDWSNRAPVLLERDGLRGDSAPRRETREEAAGGAVSSIALRGRDGGAAAEVGDDCAFTLRASGGGGDKHYVMIPVEVAPTTPARSTAGGGLGTDFDLDGGLIPKWPAQVACTLNASFGDKQGLEDQHALHGASLFIPATAHTLRADGFDASEDGTGRAVGLGMAVRRVTPRECERLQGAPDNWTLVPNKHGKPMADGPRYKMLGNSFAVPCITWIGRQIQRAHEATVQLEDAA